MAIIKPIDKNKRRHVRTNLQVPIVFQGREKLLWSLSEDIGRGGLFLRSWSPPDPGEGLTIHLADPGAGEALVLSGKVIHRRAGNTAAFPAKGEKSPPGVGVAFSEIPAPLAERLGVLLATGGLSPAQGEASLAVSAPGEGEGQENCQVLEDPTRIRQIFERLCKKIRPVGLKRLGGQIHYTAYFGGVVGASAALRVKVDAVELKDFDSIFSEAVPFVCRFNLDDQVYSFSVAERPGAMVRSWSIPLPSRLRSRPERRHPRYSDALEHPLTVEFTDPSDRGFQRVKNVADISFGGLAFKNYPGEELYSPGQLLDDIKVCDFDHVCRRTRGVVRHASYMGLPDGEVFQKVGVEFTRGEDWELKEVPSVKEGELEKIESPASILQHLKKVASNGVKILSGLDHSILFSDGRLLLEKKNDGLDLRVASRSLSQGPESDFVEARLTYHYLYHGTYHFFSARTRKQHGSLCLEMPAVISRARRRRVVRVQPEGLVKTRFRCYHPLFGKKFTFSVRDLSIRGLSFDSDYMQDLFWKGFRLRNCEIMLEDGYSPLGSVEVRSLVQAVTGNGEWKKHCGVEFLELPEATERRISSYIFQETNPHVRPPTAERIEALWQLFERSGFIYPAKMAYIQKIRPEIDETWKKLLSDEIPFYKQIVFREGQEELGTASAVQVYEHTWLFQHLAASSHPVRLISKDVMLGLAHFLMENRNTKYLYTYFRKENSFPRKMYAGFLDRYPSEDQFCFAVYSFLSLNLDGQERTGEREGRCTMGPGGRTLIGHATDADREVIESYFQKHLHPLLIRSRSLSKDALHLPETSALFRAKGLRRERSCLVAKQGGSLVAFALLENSSPGINLSGLLNTFSIYTVHPEDESVRDARWSLLLAVLDCYRTWGARVAICLTDEDDLRQYLEAGFRKEKEYVCLSWSRRMIKNYYDYVQERFGRFEERRQRVSGEPSNS